MLQRILLSGCPASINVRRLEPRGETQVSEYEVLLFVPLHHAAAVPAVVVGVVHASAYLRAPRADACLTMVTTQRQVGQLYMHVTCETLVC